MVSGVVWLAFARVPTTNLFPGSCVSRTPLFLGSNDPTCASSGRGVLKDDTGSSSARCSVSVLFDDSCCLPAEFEANLPALGVIALGGNCLRRSIPAMRVPSREQAIAYWLKRVSWMKRPDRGLQDFWRGGNLTVRRPASPLPSHSLDGVSGLGLVLVCGGAELAFKPTTSPLIAARNTPYTLRSASSDSAY